MADEDDELDSEEVKKSKEYVAQVRGCVDDAGNETVNPEEDTFSLTPNNSYNPELECEQSCRFDRESNTLVLPRPLVKFMEKRGDGGEGKVYRGEMYLGLGRPLDVAVKVSHRDSKSRAAMKRAALLASTLHHHTIAKTFFHQSGVEEDYVIMQWIDGANLKEITQRHEDIGLRVPPSLVSFFVWVLSEGLDIAQNPAYKGGKLIRPGILHRDFTPENVVITESGSPLLVDFGTGILDTELRSQGPKIAGKIGYIAPEFFGGDGARIDRRSDIYGCGVTLYSVISGANPFRAGISPSEDVTTSMKKYRKNIERVVPKLCDIDARVDRSLSDVVSKCMEKDPSRRYRDCVEMKKALTTYLYPPGGGFGPSQKGTERYMSLFRVIEEQSRATQNITGECIEDVLLQIDLPGEWSASEPESPLRFVSKGGKVHLNRIDGGYWVVDGNRLVEG